MRLTAQEVDTITALEEDLNRFLLYYIFNRRHGGLQKELKVRTPFEAIESWFQSKPELFKISPEEFKRIAFEALDTQRGET